MLFSKGFVASVLLATSVVFASPLTPELAKRGAALTAQYATETELENNLWGEASASAGGSQTTQADSVNGNTIAWHTTYNWAGANNQVKSYANVNLLTGTSKQLSAIQSIPTTWQWTYTSASSNLVADVSYDLWLSNTPGSTGATSQSSYEVMIWLSDRGGANPAGSNAGTVSINGQNWTLWKGTVGSWKIFSFVAPSETTNFSADLKPFFTYLTNSQGVSASSYLVQAQSGTEPFIGSATLTTSAYQLAIN
ncbi:glycoside hydrolase family 12 protein [Gymnopilus junonius]|uniref:Glycoside hydrolase family 12 protein n=1 Tax=Gymnopilus junonius TaxID=109634 RepID=A0A9P5NUT6_GYMJU|nr:glycoside hydrolase family 12 protein [Gymnopilus junonius]